MHLVAVTSVKNEIDIIEAFVRHTLAHVDHLLILDNGSSDGTLDVLHALQTEGLSLEIIEDPTPGKYHARRSTGLMQTAATRAGADWVLMLDADEFLVIPADSALVPPDADPSRPIALPWRTYVPHETDDPAVLNPVQRLQHRRVQEGTAWSKLLVPRALAARPESRLTSGSHDLFLGEERCEPVPAAHAFLAHFPVRGPGQYQAKIAINHLQYQTMADRDPNWGWHYRAPYALLKADPQAFAASYREAARRYSVLFGHSADGLVVRDPMDYRGGPLRHTPMPDESVRAWQAVLNFAEDLANRFATLRASLDAHGRYSLNQQTALVADLHRQLAEKVKVAISLWTERDRLRELVADQNRALDRCRAQADADRQRERYERAQVEEECRAAELGRAQALVDFQRERHEVMMTRQQLHQTEAVLHHTTEILWSARHSWTWRAGRCVVGPVSLLRRVGRAVVRRARMATDTVRAIWSRPRVQPQTIAQAKRVILGAADTRYPGWYATNRDGLDVTREDDFARYWAPNSRVAFLAEHVWEHLSDRQAEAALRNCFRYLRPGGRLRLAVPDALHPEPAYREWVRPGGSGPGADDHHVFYDYRSLRSLLERAGFRVRLLEYWDEQGRFHARRWSSADGHIERSIRFDRRERPGIRRYTSLIVDAHKPAGWLRRRRPAA